MAMIEGQVVAKQDDAEGRGLQQTHQLGQRIDVLAVDLDQLERQVGFGLGVDLGMYFLIIRPQRTQLKKRGEMLAAVRRGDTVVTGGGFVGKVTKVIDDNELEIDLGGGTKVTALRSTIADVRVKGEPVANQNAKK